jgi:hypothetical protein
VQSAVGQGYKHSNSCSIGIEVRLYRLSAGLFKANSQVI